MVMQRGHYSEDPPTLEELHERMHHSFLGT